MMAVLILVVFVAFAGCEHLQTYESRQTGPRAKISFTSPYLEDRFLSIDGLDLQLWEPDANCTLATKGRISLSPGTKIATVYVPANRRAYFSVWQRNTSILGDRNNARQGFSFVPEDGAEYTVEHIDNPARLRVQYYKHDSDGKKIPFEVQGLNVCDAKSD
jgi:hypothetical protein